MAVANRILMYNTKKGEIVKALKGKTDKEKATKTQSTRLLSHRMGRSSHQEGKLQAHKRADNLVLLWSRDGKGITSYKHSRKIQALAFNPLLQTVSSGFTIACKLHY